MGGGWPTSARERVAVAPRPRVAAHAICNLPTCGSQLREAAQKGICVGAVVSAPRPFIHGYDVYKTCRVPTGKLENWTTGRWAEEEPD